MTLIDALQEDGSYSPDKLTDVSEAMTSEGLENLVDSIISDYDSRIPPKDEVSSVVMEAFNSVKEEIKDSLQSLTERYISDLEMSNNTVSESTSRTQDYVDSVKEIISRGLEVAVQRSGELTFEDVVDAIPDSDSLKSMITEGLSGLNTSITKEVEVDDYYKSMIDAPDDQSSQNSEPENPSSQGRDILFDQSHEKTDQVWKNLGDNISKNFDTDSLGSVGNTWAGVGSQLKGNYTNDAIGSELSKPITDFVSSFVSEVLEVPTQAITRSDAFNAIVNPFSVVSGIASEVSDEALRSFNKSYEDIIKTSVESVDEIYNAGKEWVTDQLKGPVSEVAGKVNKWSNDISKQVLDWRDDTLKLIKPNDMQLDNSKDTKWPKFSEPLSNVSLYPANKDDSKPKVTENFKIDSHTAETRQTEKFKIKPYKNGNISKDAVRRTDFFINKEDMYMSNDAYWDIKIFPHEYNGYGPPDINDIFGCSSSNRLPIISYTLDAGGLSNSSFEIYPGVQFSIPTSYSRPSTLSFAILNLLKGSVGNQMSCFDFFRDSYISWVVGGSRSPSEYELNLNTLPACLDYHYCAYEITITKYSPQWFPLRKWSLLGIPQISIYEQGGSSSSQEIQNLNFSIIGIKPWAKYMLTPKMREGVRAKMEAEITAFDHGL